MAASKRVIVTGATGLIGKALCKALIAKGYAVVVFARNLQRARQIVPNAEYVEWQASEQGAWTGAIDSAYAIIHLAGASLFAQRWSQTYKRDIITSREVGTRGIVNAMAQAQSKPQVFISGSAVGYYGINSEQLFDESAPAGHDFLAHVCQIWEREGKKAEELGIRTVIVRTGIVVGNSDNTLRLPIDIRGASLNRPGVVLKTDEGAFALLMLPFRLFIGGPVLPGTQWLAWIHIDDLVGILLFALEHTHVAGPINAAAPTPQTNRDFAKTLGRVMHRPAWLPVPGFALKLLLGEMAYIITSGQRVSVQKVLQLGYRFTFPTSEQAIQDILRSGT